MAEKDVYHMLAMKGYFNKQNKETIMNQTELNNVLELHKLWLEGDEDGVRADLEDANLRDANLKGANLEGANLEGADLEDADLRGANLRDADLYKADLRGVDLYGANLKGANLEGANLRFADLSNANLSGANLEDADLRSAIRNINVKDEEKVVEKSQKENAFKTQVAGNHYSKLKIQPMEYNLANDLNYGQANAIKYVTRYKDKNGIEDLKKAIHCIELLIEFESRK